MSWCRSSILFNHLPTVPHTAGRHKRKRKCRIVTTVNVKCTKMDSNTGPRIFFHASLYEFCRNLRAVCNMIMPQNRKWTCSPQFCVRVSKQQLHPVTCLWVLKIQNCEERLAWKLCLQQSSTYKLDKAVHTAWGICHLHNRRKHHIQKK